MARRTTSDKNPASALKPDHGKPADGNPAASVGEAIRRVMTAVPYIRKRGTMAGGGSYKYVRDTDVIALLKPPMIDNALILTGPHEIRNRAFGTVTTGGGKSMNHTTAEFLFRLLHVPTGQTSDYWAIGEGADSLDKSSNKAMSAARKYALMLAFNLTTGDDPDSFDEEGQYNANEERGPGDKAEPPKPAQKSEPKKSEAKPGSALPANGKELHERLSSYDEKLSGQKLCVRGALLAHVIQAGVKAGYTANMTEWAGAAISFAVEAVKGFEQEARAAYQKKREETEAAAREAVKDAVQVTQPTPAPTAAPAPGPVAGPAPAPAEVDQAEAAERAEAARLEALRAASAADQLAAKGQESLPPSATEPPAVKPSVQTPAPPAQLSAQDRFDKRIAGMNATGLKANLDKYREKYTQDAEMTATQKAELEKCYWSNVQRIDNKGKAGTEVKG